MVCLTNGMKRNRIETSRTQCLEIKTFADLILKYEWNVSLFVYFFLISSWFLFLAVFFFHIKPNFFISILSCISLSDMCLYLLYMSTEKNFPHVQSSKLSSSLMHFSFKLFCPFGVLSLFFCSQYRATPKWKIYTNLLSISRQYKSLGKTHHPHALPFRSSAKSRLFLCRWVDDDKIELIVNWHWYAGSVRLLGKSIAFSLGTSNCWFGAFFHSNPKFASKMK